MRKITERQQNYIKQIHYHIKRACPQWFIDKHDLLKMPTTKENASKYITSIGEFCRMNNHLLNEEDDHTDRLHLNKSIKTLYIDVDEFGNSHNDYLSNYSSINCKDDM